MDISARTVLAVCAHPDDESFGLGAVISTLAAQGVATDVLCFTHGEASTLGVGENDLALVREGELAAAAAALGVRSMQLLHHPDGALAATSVADLSREVQSVATPGEVDCLLVFDEGGITGHPDHRQATAAALAAADRLDLDVLAWVLPSSVAAALNDEFHATFVGRDHSEIDITLDVDRGCQRAAISCHASQSTDNPVLARRLQLQGATESLRWLRRSHRIPTL